MTRKRGDLLPLEDDPLWYKDALIYELHVRSFADSDGDGIGDFRGLTEKLDYLYDLGVTALWLLPFYPSPLKDDGYDIADYNAVHPSYGNVEDFRTFLHEAHRRGLRVITELVINHTSDQHPWFQRARQPGVQKAFRDFYVWSDTPEKYKDARIIFKDFEASNWTWDRTAGAYYWHRFYSHQPDLNFESALVQRSVTRAMDFWFKMGVDGLRLDAIPYLYEREGTSSENLPETHAFLKNLRTHVDRRYRNRMLLAEANQWPEDAVAYLGDGDECHMAFHFPVMPRLYMAVWMEDRYPIIEILEQTPAIPESAQWAVFLRNHDELTLEMVTDEDRDYMYRVYAHDPQMRINLGIRRRLAPLLGNHRRRIELMNGLLFSLPGTPVIYYGDELGMGDNVYLGDRNGVRTPMQWSGDRNAGFSRANPQRLFLPVIIDPEYHYEAVNVEAQQNNQHSLLWWMKRLIALRKHHKVFSRGSLEFLHPENRKVLAFVRRFGDEQALVVANLSRFAQGVELDLSEWKGMMPVEMFGRTEFPAVGEHPYFITLAPHGFFWFMLQPVRVEIGAQAGVPVLHQEEHAVPVLTVQGAPAMVFSGRSKTALEGVLQEHLRTRRWFGGKSRTMRSATIQEAVPVPYGDNHAYLTVLKVDYSQGDPESYMLPLTFSAPERMNGAEPIAYLKSQGQDLLLYDAMGDKEFAQGLPQAVARRRRFKGTSGDVVGEPSPKLRGVLQASGGALETTGLRGEQSNSSLVYGNSVILKLFRKVDQGSNPDLEIGRFLTERQGFQHSPAVLGSIELRRPRQEPLTLAVLHQYIENEGDAWSYTLDVLGQYFERVLALAPDEVAGTPLPSGSLLELAAQTPPSDTAHELIGAYPTRAELLGQRTAELHLALASDSKDPSFAPEPFTPHYQQSLYQAVRGQAVQALQLLKRWAASLPEEAQEDARQLLALESKLHERIRSIGTRPLSGMRIRCHGDYHLGQVLYTGKDFAIIDFEGEPARPLSERRIKRSPLRDVAGMLRSFDYAAHAALSAGSVREEDIDRLEPWSRFWSAWVSAAFLRAYLEKVEGSGLLPRGAEEVELLLSVLLMEKGFYELGYELNNRPDWVGIPLRGLLELLE